MRIDGLRAVTILVGVLILLGSPSASSADPESPEVRRLKEEIQRLKSENDANRKRMEELERKVDQIGARTEEKQKQLETEISKGPSPGVIRQALGSYWGDGRFVITGYGFGEHDWNRNAATNSFTAGFNPVFLFRLNDRILFESELEVKLPDDAESEVHLEFAQADIFLNRYMTLAAGKYLLPFGDFIERLHPPWINKFVTHPLPFREGDEGGILPFSDIGVQLRGGIPLGGVGTSLEYTAYIGNGPKFATADLGSGFDFNNVDNNRGKGYGARFAVYPLPLDAGLGRLGLGASTFDGKWDDSGDLWFYSWGVHGLYQLAAAELRGEYLETQREMPAGSGVDHDDRQGWYVQGAYSLSQLDIPHLNRMELLARYSGQNQRAVTSGDLVAHPRQASLGVDYWFTPSVVFKLEYDRDMPRGDKYDHEIHSQIAVGF